MILEIVVIILALFFAEEIIYIVSCLVGFVLGLVIVAGVAALVFVLLRLLLAFVGFV